MTHPLSILKKILYCLLPGSNFEYEWGVTFSKASTLTPAQPRFELVDQNQGFSQDNGTKCLMSKFDIFNIDY